MKLNSIAVGDWVVWWWGDWKQSSITGERWLPLRFMNARDGTPGKGRRSYAIAWNGARFAKTSDAEVMDERYPGELEGLALVLPKMLPPPTSEQTESTR